MNECYKHEALQTYPKNNLESFFSGKKRNRIVRQVVEGLCVVKELYAHSANSQGQRHRLDNHLKAVDALSRKFADKFGVKDLSAVRICGVIWECPQETF